MILNKIFRTVDGLFFNRVNPDEVKTKGNFITVSDGNALAIIDGVEVPMPSVLYNEVGVEYHYVDYKEHGKKMAEKHGTYYAVKQEPIRIWRNVKPGDKLQSVIDGFLEHEISGLQEGHLAAQNVIKGEFYAISEKILDEKYKYEKSEGDYDLYVPKSDAVSAWVYSDVNTFGVLWGAFEFLTTPMINVTDPNDVYGCNYIVWWGNDGRLSSYKVLAYVSTEKHRYYDVSMGKPKAAAECPFEPPKLLAC